MRHELNFWVLGGDMRQGKLAQLLAEDGHRVHTYALEDGAVPAPGLTAEPGLSGVEQADCVVLPLPVSSGGGLLNAPLSRLSPPLTEILAPLSPGQMLCGGRVDPVTAALAAERGLTYDFREADLKGMHENSVRLEFTMEDGSVRRIAGSSIGGGQIMICEIDGTALELSAQLPTLVIRQHDKKGVLSNVTKVLADNDINIGVMKLSRSSKGQEALCVIETDSPLTEEIVSLVRAQDNIISAQALSPDA